MKRARCAWHRLAGSAKRCCGRSFARCAHTESVLGRVVVQPVVEPGFSGLCRRLSFGSVVKEPRLPDDKTLPRRRVEPTVCDPGPSRASIAAARGRSGARSAFIAIRTRFVLVLCQGTWLRRMRGAWGCHRRAEIGPGRGFPGSSWGRSRWLRCSGDLGRHRNRPLWVGCFLPSSLPCPFAWGRPCTLYALATGTCTEVVRAEQAVRSADVLTRPQPRAFRKGDGQGTGSGSRPCVRANTAYCYTAARCGEGPRGWAVDFIRGAPLECRPAPLSERLRGVTPADRANHNVGPDYVPSSSELRTRNAIDLDGSPEAANRRSGHRKRRCVAA